MDLATIVTSGLVAAVVSSVLSWALGLHRDREVADRTRLEKHRDRVQAAVADFVALDHARHVASAAMTMDMDVVAQAAEEVQNPAANAEQAQAASERAQVRIKDARPMFDSRTLETDQAIARVRLLDHKLGTLARKVADARPAPGYPRTADPGPDKHADALDELIAATQRVLGVPGA